MSKKNYRLYTGDALEVMGQLLDDSIDAIVTDPPYGIAFNNHAWDKNVPSVALWEQALRVLKPGGHLIAFSSARTYHLLAQNIDRAGFDIRDQLMWLYGTGLPCSHSIALAITKKYGSSKAKKWRGWRTTLKPAHDPIVLARKPFSGTVSENVLRYGTGALNIDACRVGDFHSRKYARSAKDNVISLDNAKRRFPANVVHDGLQTPWASYFYCPKPTTKERDRGLEKFKLRSAQERTRSKCGVDVKFRGANGAARNSHPTVKPVKLMEYLIKLVTPEGGTVLDPFAGSGTTLVAAQNLGVASIGIDLDPEYIAIAKARLAA